MYNYQGNQYGGQPYGGFQGQNAPQYGAPPGMGSGFVPDQQYQEQQMPRQANFQQPPNMPNINMSAPIIRLGTSGPGPGAAPENFQQQQQRPIRLGLGGDMNVQRQNMAQLQPPTKDEVVKTLYVGGLSDALDQNSRIERVLHAVGPLRRWIRATDATGKTCKFGFAEYESSEGLATAIELLKDLEIATPDGTAGEKDEPKLVKTKLALFVDDASYRYIEHWESSRGNQDPIQAQFRLETAKSNLAQTLAKIANPALATEDDFAMLNGHMNGQVDGMNANGVITIPLSTEDELSDIPAEMRELVAREISGFRERSTKRDMERLKREEEMEAIERRRAAGDSRPGRMASPPLARVAGGANVVPLGTKDRTLLNAPNGPRRLTEPRRTEEDSDASDEEIERRRKEKKETEEEKLYQDQKRRWLNREKSRTAAVEREKARDRDGNKDSRKEVAGRRLAEWDDDVEAERKVEDYYADHGLWARKRHTFRAHEARMDELDREEEYRDQAKEPVVASVEERIKPAAVETPKEPQRIKLSLGAAAQKAQQAQQAQNTTKRTAAEVEGLLEDEGDVEEATKRTLVPIKFDNAADALGLTEEERAQAARQLAADIPSDKAGLWKWPIKWDFVDDAVLTDQLRPFVEKKVVEYLGVQEQMLVELVEAHIRKRGEPQALVAELEGALDEEAEVLVKKLWRMIIFFSESEKKGLSSK